ncbi:ABC transporter substrate-binding protein [Haoranjiania flava]|uniref:ABC transporter substrate-binding protein n=1 Tax=Haoranjiania flava TaxID=1856322 RepID=A0AAE3LKE9_9BACT|nr:ABC transporter substrate-binding protein [Haoranjiania flava]MCU7694528.1 ABC transporter substrate-binding protein [Haoranjiania flava]
MCRTQNITYLFTSLVFLLSIVSCKNQSTDDSQVFYYNESSGVQTLDPAFARSQSVMWTVHQLYNTLVEIDSNLNIVPGIAKRWNISPDRLVYTFYLRDSIYFHDNDAFPNGRGRKLTASDVAYSLNRIIDPATASPGAWIFNERINKDGFRAVNDTIFELHLSRPFHPILGILSMPYCSIVPKEAVEKYGKDFRKHPCGTGPFMLRYWDEGQAMVLEKNTNYWEYDSSGKRLPYLKAVSISYNTNKATEFLLLRQNKLSFINDVDAAFKDEVISKKGELRDEWKDKFVLKKGPFMNVEYYGILVDESNPLVKNSPLKIKKIRQAINYGIDRNKFMLYLRNSLGMAAEAGFVPRGLPSENTEFVKGYNYDPAKALQLLKEAGFPKGKNLPVIKLISVPMYADIGSFVARELENIGIKLQLEVLQKSVLMEQTAKSQAAFFRGSWIADYPDAENYLAVFYSKNPAPPNYTRYNNAAYDRLYEEAIRETNDSLRYNLYRKMDQMIMNDAPIVPLFYDEVIRLIQPKVKNFYSDPMNMLELRRVYMEE